MEEDSEWEPVVGGYARQVRKNGISYTVLLWRGRKQQVWYLTVGGDTLKIGRYRLSLCLESVEHNLFSFLGYEKL